MTITSSPWFWQVAARSCLLLLWGFVLERVFNSNRRFRSRLWLAIFISLNVILLPLPALNLRVLASRTPQTRQTTIYEVQPGFRNSSQLGPASRTEIQATTLFVSAALLGAAFWTVRVFRTWRLIRRSQQCADTEAVASVYEVSECLGLSDAPLLLLSDEIDSPCVAGIINPVLLIPAKQVLNWTASDWQVMLNHELTHLRSLDHWKVAFTDLVAAIYWWNLLCWFAHRQARLAFEMECDQRSSQVDKAGYAQILTSRQVQNPGTGPVRFWNRGSTLNRVRGLSVNSTSKWPTLTIFLIVPIIWPATTQPRLNRHFDPNVIGLDEVVFCSNRTGSPALFRMFLDGTHQVQMPLTFNGAMTPSISPDGTQIVYVKEEQGQRHIFIAQTSGMYERRVVALTQRDDQPIFSPDGHLILFMSNNGKRWLVGIADLRTGHSRFLKGDQFRGLEAKWHPSGKRICLSVNRTGHQKIWSVNLDGTDLVQLTRGDFDDTGSSYSADGRLLTYSSHQPLGFKVCAIDLLTGKDRQLTTTPSDDVEARTGPYSDQVFFNTNRSGRSEITSMDFDGSEQTVLTDQGESGWPVCRN